MKIIELIVRGETNIDHEEKICRLFKDHYLFSRSNTYKDSYIINTMKAYSIDYPENTFIFKTFCIDEVYTDYFTNGKTQRCQAKIIYDNFNIINYK